MTEIELQWRKSSFSDTKGNCVEVAAAGAEVAVRNSNRPEAGILLFTHDEISAWIQGVKSGEFDDLG
jgi:Domain of unknown function (DUF397)